MGAARLPCARGKAAFDGEIESDAAVGSPTLHLDRLIEEGDTVVAIGSGEMTLKEAGRVAFVFAEVFTFTGGRISRLETFHITSAAGDTEATFRAHLGDVADAAPSRTTATR